MNQKTLDDSVSLGTSSEPMMLASGQGTQPCTAPHGSIWRKAWGLTNTAAKRRRRFISQIMIQDIHRITNLQGQQHYTPLTAHLFISQTPSWSSLMNFRNFSDFRNHSSDPPPRHTGHGCAERVQDFHFLGLHICNSLTWSAIRDPMTGGRWDSWRGTSESPGHHQELHTSWSLSPSRLFYSCTAFYSPLNFPHVFTNLFINTWRILCGNA